MKKGYSRDLLPEHNKDTPLNVDKALDDFRLHLIATPPHTARG